MKKPLDTLMNSSGKLPFIVAITETWFDDDIDDSLFLCKGTHSIFRCDRVPSAEKEKGGGVCLLVDKGIKAIAFQVDGIKNLEYVCVRLNIGNSLFYIAVCYKPSVHDSFLFDDVKLLVEFLNGKSVPYI